MVNVIKDHKSTHFWEANLRKQIPGNASRVRPMTTSKQLVNLMGVEKTTRHTKMGNILRNDKRQIFSTDVTKVPANIELVRTSSVSTVQQRPPSMAQARISATSAMDVSHPSNKKFFDFKKQSTDMIKAYNSHTSQLFQGTMCHENLRKNSAIEQRSKKQMRQGAAQSSTCNSGLEVKGENKFRLERRSCEQYLTRKQHKKKNNLL